MCDQVACAFVINVVYFKKQKYLLFVLFSSKYFDIPKKDKLSDLKGHDEVND